MRKVAVTGGLSCGKSTVCQFLREFGAFVISADQIVHQLLSPATPLGKEVLQLLGQEIVIDGEISREAIAKKVFSDPALLKALETLLHPAVQNEIERRYQEIKNDPSTPLFVVEIPLLFESALDWDFNTTLAVVSNESLCRKRFVAQGGDKATYEGRASRQLSMKEKSDRADQTIENSGTLDELKQATHALYNELI